MSKLPRTEETTQDTRDTQDRHTLQMAPAAHPSSTLCFFCSSWSKAWYATPKSTMSMTSASGRSGPIMFSQGTDTLEGERWKHPWGRCACQRDERDHCHLPSEQLCALLLLDSDAWHFKHCFSFKADEGKFQKQKTGLGRTYIVSLPYMSML